MIHLAKKQLASSLCFQAIVRIFVLGFPYDCGEVNFELDVATNVMQFHYLSLNLMVCSVCLKRMSC